MTSCVFPHRKKKKKVHRVGSTLRMVKAGLAASQRCDGELTFRFGRRMKTRDKSSFFSGFGLQRGTIRAVFDR